MAILRILRSPLVLAAARGALSLPTSVTRPMHGIPALFLALSAVPLHAEDAPAQTGELQEIVVTARFRPESAQNVGESIRVFANQELQDLESIRLKPWPP